MNHFQEYFEHFEEYTIPLPPFSMTVIKFPLIANLIQRDRVWEYGGGKNVIGLV